MDEHSGWNAPVEPRKIPIPPDALKDPRDLAKAIVEAAWSKNGYQTKVLDVSKLVSYTDIFVILTGRSDRHTTAIAEAIETTLKGQGMLPAGVEGRQAGTWVLLDYGSVVVHVFEKNTRDYYDLEHLWADAEVIPAEEPQWVQDFARMESGEYS